MQEMLRQKDEEINSLKELLAKGTKTDEEILFN